jgi:hypothetical protein
MHTLPACFFLQFTEVFNSDHKVLPTHNISELMILLLSKIKIRLTNNDSYSSYKGEWILRYKVYRVTGVDREQISHYQYLWAIPDLSKL